MRQPACWHSPPGADAYRRFNRRESVALSHVVETSRLATPCWTNEQKRTKAGSDQNKAIANLASGLSRERVEGRLALALRRLVSRHMGLRLVLVRFRFLFFLISFLSLRHGDPPDCSLDPPF